MLAQRNTRSSRRLTPVNRSAPRDLLPWADPYIASLFNEKASRPVSMEDEPGLDDEIEIDFNDSPRK